MGILYRFRSRETSEQFLDKGAQGSYPSHSVHEQIPPSAEASSSQTGLHNPSSTNKTAKSLVVGSKPHHRTSILKLRSRSATIESKEAPLPMTTPAREEKSRSFASSSSLSSRFTSDSRKHTSVVPTDTVTKPPSLPARSDSLSGFHIGYEPNDAKEVQDVTAPSARILRSSRTPDAQMSSLRRNGSRTGERGTGQVIWDEEDPAPLGRRKWKGALLKAKRPQTADGARSASHRSKFPGVHSRRSIDGMNAASSTLPDKRGIPSPDSDVSARGGVDVAPQNGADGGALSKKSFLVKSPASSPSLVGKATRSRSGTTSAYVSSPRQYPSNSSASGKMASTPKADVRTVFRHNRTPSAELQEAVDRLDVSGASFIGASLTFTIVETVKSIADCAAHSVNQAKMAGKKTRIAIARPHTSSGAPPVPSTDSEALEVAMCRVESAVMSRLYALIPNGASRLALVQRGLQLDTAFLQARNLLNLGAPSVNIRSALAALDVAEGDESDTSMVPPLVVRDNRALRPAPRRGRSRRGGNDSVSPKRSSPDTSPFLQTRRPSYARSFQTSPRVQSERSDDSLDPYESGQTVYGHVEGGALTVVSAQPLTPLTPMSSHYSSQSSALTSVPASPVTDISCSTTERKARPISRNQVLTPEAFSTRARTRPRRTAGQQHFSEVDLRPLTDLLANC